jgi:hypothetical protein
MNVDSLKSLIGARGGHFQPNRFQVIFSPPTFLDGVLPEAASAGFSIASAIGGGSVYTLLCESASMPGRQISTFEYPFKNLDNPVKVPNGLTFGDIECVFMLTNAFDIKLIFETWLANIITEDYLLHYTDQYERTILINALDQRNRPIMSCELKNAYPITVNDIALSNASTNEIGKLSVSFTYSNYTLRYLNPLGI